MDKLEKNQANSFDLISYEVSGNKIVLNYMDGTITDDVPNNEHNIEVCERKLLRQFEKNKEEQEKSFKLCLKNGISFIMLFSFTGGLALSDCAYAAAISSVYLILNTAFHMKQSIGKIHRLRLTDFCLQHAYQFKFSEDGRDASYTLSTNGKKAFKLDHGFKLNHSHLYTNKDLKQLKKVIGK